MMKGDVWEHATRIGSLALLISSIVSLLTAVLLPHLTHQPPSNWTSTYRKTSGNRNWNEFITPWLSMRRLWVMSSALFAMCMFCTLFVSSTAGTIIISGIVGMSWAVASWIPYTFLSLEISHCQHSSGIANGLHQRNEVHAGFILGMHNIAICIPQILISLGSSFLWKSQEDFAQLDANSTGWVLRIGGVAALIASWLTMKRIQEP